MNEFNTTFQVMHSNVSNGSISRANVYCLLFAYEVREQLKKNYEIYPEIY